MGLPHYMRYSITGVEDLDSNHPVHSYLAARVQTKVAGHRRRQGEPHCEPPQLEVTRVQQIHSPRLQDLYLAGVQDIAGLCNRKVSYDLSDKLDAPRVTSYHGLDLNEALLFHGVHSDIVTRLANQ